MSETFSKIILTNSNTQNAKPSSADLSHGELAINYKDGKIFFKDDEGLINTIATTQVISDLDDHINDTNNPHGVTAEKIGLGNVKNTSDLAKPISTATQEALDLKADISDTYTKSQVDQQISTAFNIEVLRGGLSVTAEGTPSGNGALTYNNQTGEFTYTPPALSEQGGITTSSLSVGAEGTPAGNGAISYNYDNQYGVFTYTPPVLNGLTATGDTNFGSNKILYSNFYSNIGDLPDASTYHGMFAHVHATGAAYFAHAGNWIELANNNGIIEDLNTLDTVTGEDKFIVSTGDGSFAYQTGPTVRDSLGLGIDDTPEFNGIDLDGGELILNSTGEVKIKPVIDQTQQETPNTIDFILSANQTTESKLQISYAMVDNGGGAILPTTTNDIDLGSATNEFKDLYIDGTANIDTLSADNATIDNINIDGNTISSTDVDGDINITPNGAGKTIVNGQLNATSFKLNGGGVVDLFQKFSSEQDFGEIAADSFSEVTITATGVSVGDFIFTATPPGLDQHLLSTARCEVAGEIELRVYNMKNQAITPDSDTWYFLAVSFS